MGVMQYYKAVISQASIPEVYNIAEMASWADVFMELKPASCSSLALHAHTCDPWGTTQHYTCLIWEA